MRVEGLEPPRPFGHQILSLARLPFRHTRNEGRDYKGAGVLGATRRIDILGLDGKVSRRQSEDMDRRDVQELRPPNESKGVLQERPNIGSSKAAIVVVPLAVALASAFALFAAHVMEWMKMAPCELCLRQREAYWIAIPLAVAAGLSPILWRRSPRWLPQLLLIASGAALLYGAGRALEHIGVVSHWWISACTSPKHLSLDDVLSGRAGAPLVPCDQAPKFLGISLPAYNFALAVALSAFALSPAVKAFIGGRKHEGAR